MKLPLSRSAAVVVLTILAGSSGCSKSKGSGSGAPETQVPGDNKDEKKESGDGLEGCDGLERCGGEKIGAHGDTVAVAHKDPGKLFVSKDKAATFRNRTDALLKALSSQEVKQSDLELKAVAVGEGLVLVGIHAYGKCPTPTEEADGNCEFGAVLASEDQGETFRKLDLGTQILGFNMDLFVTKDGPLVVDNEDLAERSNPRKIFVLNRSDLKVARSISYSGRIDYRDGHYLFHYKSSPNLSTLRTASIDDAAEFDAKSHKFVLYANDPARDAAADPMILQAPGPVCIAERCQTYEQSADGTGIEILSFNPNEAGKITLTGRIENASSPIGLVAHAINDQIVGQAISVIDGKVHQTFLLTSGEPKPLPVDQFPFMDDKVDAQAIVPSVVKTEDAAQDIYVLGIGSLTYSHDRGKTWTRKTLIK